MPKVQVRAVALRYERDPQPGIVYFAVEDCDRRTHHFVDKVVAITTDDLNAATPYPVEIWLDADVESSEGDRITVTFDYFVETDEGIGTLTVPSRSVSRRNTT